MRCVPGTLTWSDLGGVPQFENLTHSILWSAQCQFATILRNESLLESKGKKISQQQKQFPEH